MSFLTQKQGTPQVTTQNNQVPAYVQTAQQNLLSTGQNLAQPFVENQPAFGVAGFTPDQEMGFDLSRDMAEQSFTPQAINDPYYINPAQAQYSRGVMPQDVNYTGAEFTRGAMPEAITAPQAQFSRADAHQLNPNDYKPFLDPYIHDVVDTTRDVLRDELGRTEAGISARGASSSAFGGAREALRNSEAERNFGDTVARTTAQLMSQGFDKASAEAMANTQLRQQTELQETALRNAMTTHNADLSERASEFNSGERTKAEMQDTALRNAMTTRNSDAADRAAMFSSGQHNQAEMQDTALRNAMIGANAGLEERADEANSLQIPVVQSGLADAEQRRRATALQQLLGTGALQQATAQKAIDLPADWLARLGQITPTATGSNTTTTTPTTSNPLATLTGLASLAKGVGSLFALSDENEKTNKQKLGKDPATGVDIYAYDYKEDVAAAKKGGKPMPPKRVGPMAQDVEKAAPGSTTKVGGKKVIRPGALSAMMGV